MDGPPVWRLWRQGVEAEERALDGTATIAFIALVAAFKVAGACEWAGQAGLCWRMLMLIDAGAEAEEMRLEGYCRCGVVFRLKVAGCVG